ncbi:MAG: ImmA/IrrE family metallo-endopeptidase [Deltaproteobacteria bacterium]|nr:ImmA/IrrE family metallo-endopeptidase [Deltaproteobacteria bacterium]
MVLNAAHPPSRRQFTLGHELGHFMSTRDVVDIEGGGCEDSAVAERFANAFSASLLMPAPALRGCVAEITDQSGKFTVAAIFFMAEEFAVSREAMCRRRTGPRAGAPGTGAPRPESANKLLFEERRSPARPPG